MNSAVTSRMMKFVSTGLAIWVLTACSSSPPDGLSVVSDFDVNRYEGRWYEIVRLDHRFERGLSNVTADYALQDDGTVSVTNRGYKAAEQQWDEANGTARFVGDPTQGSLKVSFFGPFYGGYHIIALDQDEYQWAMVTGPNRNYFWILSRQPELDSAIHQQLLEQAQASGFAVDEFIEVDQSMNLP